MDKTALETLYAGVARYAAGRRAEDGARIHRPTASYPEQVERFRLPVQDEGVPAGQVIQELIAHAEPGLAAITGPRFHGWVMGGKQSGRRCCGLAHQPLGPERRQSLGHSIRRRRRRAGGECAARTL